MTSRWRIRALALLALSALAAALALARAAVSRMPGRSDLPQPARQTRSVSPPVPSPDPGSVRDVFSFADESRETPEPAGTRHLPEAPATAAAPAPEGPRLVGIVKRQGRLVAALALDGEVELAAPGESAVGVTVVSATEDSVRIRRSDGLETTLSLP